MIGAILGLSLLTGLTYAFTIYNATTNELSKTYQPINSEKPASHVIEASEPFTILFMGVDTGNGSRSEEWVGNSDSMLLVTVNPETKTTSMMSLERDILINISDKDGELTGSEVKLNAAYATGGPEMAIATVEDLMNIEIDHYVMINMQGMIDLVDEVGGITVNNTFDFPISIADQEPEYTQTIEPGKQLVNGEQALVYARMRYQDPEGDYGRQKRQREVIQLIIKKLLSMDSVSRYKGILSAVSNNVRTDIPINNKTIPQLLGYKEALKNIKSYQLAGMDAMLNGVSYQVVSSEHLLEMQNILQLSLGKVERTELETSAILYENLYAVVPDYSASQYEVPAYTNFDDSSTQAYEQPLVTEVPITEPVVTEEPISGQ